MHRSEAPCILALAFAACQVLVPTMHLTQPRPARFGWQMFSGVRDAMSYAVITVDAAVIPIERDEYLAYYRGDLDGLTEILARAICRQRPDATAVRTTRLLGPHRDISCP
jgi:hypothetical protein